MFFLLLFLGYLNCFEIVHHIDKKFYYEVHPLFDKKHIKQPLIKQSTKNSEYQIVSLHDDKFYDNVTWSILINKPLKFNEEDDLDIDDIKYEIEKDGCLLYTSLLTKKHKLLKIGCLPEYENVFLKPKKTNDTEFYGCEKTVRVKKKTFYKDLINLIKQPALINTLSLLIPIYGKKNIVIDKNFNYNKPNYSEKAINKVLHNYYYNNDDKKIKNDIYIKSFVQTPTPSWGIDRIDQDFGLDNMYHYANGGIDITALVIDTGILTTHIEFGGRAQMVVNTAGDGINTDCHGHGTHVSGIIGSTTYGVAKQIKLKGVKVLNCAGEGSSFTILAGVTYILSNIDILRGGSAATKKLVANLSLGGPASTTIDNAVQQLIDANIGVSVAAGNENDNACNYSPSRLSSVLTVSASDIDDLKASFSNYGSCVDLSAPGVSILSTWIGSNTALATLSGTSMASPHVSGVLATTWQIRKDLDNIAIQNLVKCKVTVDVIDGFTNSGGGKNLLFSLINTNIPCSAPVPNPNPPPPPSNSNGDSIKYELIILVSVILLVWL